MLTAGTYQELLPGQTPWKMRTVVGEGGPSQGFMTAFPLSLSFLYLCLPPQNMAFVSFYFYFSILTYVGVFLEKKNTPVLLFSFFQCSSY